MDPYYYLSSPSGRGPPPPCQLRPRTAEGEVDNRPIGGLQDNGTPRGQIQEDSRRETSFALPTFGTPQPQHSMSPSAISFGTNPFRPEHQATQRRIDPDAKSIGRISPYCIPPIAGSLQPQYSIQPITKPIVRLSSYSSASSAKPPRVEHPLIQRPVDPYSETLGRISPYCIPPIAGLPQPQRSITPSVAPIAEPYAPANSAPVATVTSPCDPGQKDKAASDALGKLKPGAPPGGQPSLEPRTEREHRGQELRSGGQMHEYERRGFQDQFAVLQRREEAAQRQAITLQQKLDTARAKFDKLGTKYRESLRASTIYSNELRTTIEGLEEEVAQMKKFNSVLGQTFDELASDQLAVENKVAELEQHSKALQEALTASLTDHADVEGQVSSLQQEIKQQGEDLAAYQTLVDDLSALKMRNEDDRVRFAEERRNLISDISQIQTSLERSDKTVRMGQEQAIQAARWQVEGLHGAKKDLERQVAKLQQDHKQSEAALQASKAEMAALQQENEKALQTIQAKLEALQQNAQEVRKSPRASQAGVVSLQQRLAQATEELQTSKAEVKALQQNYKKVDIALQASQAEVASLQQKSIQSAGALETSEAKAQAEVALQTSQAKVEALQQHIKKSAAELQTSKAEVASLQQKFRQSAGARETSEAKAQAEVALQTSQAKVQALQGDLTQAKEALQNSQAKMEVLQKSLMQSAEELQTSQAEVASLQQEGKKSEVALQASKDEVQKLQGDLTQSTAALQSATEKMEALQNGFDVSEQALRDANEECQTLSNTHRMLSIDYQKRVQQMSTLREKWLVTRGPIRTVCQIRPSHGPQDNWVTHSTKHIAANGRVSLTINRTEPAAFGLDGVFDQPGGTDLLTELGPFIESMLEGAPLLILLYGRTATGKSWTSTKIWEQVGKLVFPEADKTAIHSIAEAAGGVDESVPCLSCTEVYSLDVFDLLVDGEGSTKKQPRARILKTSSTMPGTRSQKSTSRAVHPLIDYNATTIPVQTADDLSAALKAAGSRRRTAATELNAGSSRSHAFSYLKLRSGSITIIDLAGHEKQGDSGAAKEEVTSINGELAALTSALRDLRKNISQDKRDLNCVWGNKLVSRMVGGMVLGEDGLNIKGRDAGSPQLKMMCVGTIDLSTPELAQASVHTLSSLPLVKHK